MRTAERGQEVIERSFIRHIDPCHLQTPLVTITPEQVVIPERNVKEIPLPNTGRIAVVVPCARGRNPQQRRAILRRQAWRRQRGGGRRLDSPASQACFSLLVCGQSAHVNRWLPVECSRGVGTRTVGIVRKRVVARRRSGDQAAVVAPVKADPGAPVKGQLILHVRRLVKPLIVIDAEG